MKRIISILIAVITVCAALSAVSCSCSKPEEEVVYFVQFTNSYSPNIIVDSQKVKPGEKATRPADQVREGYTFDGWYVKSVATLEDVLFDFDAPVTKDMQVFAKFTPVEAK